MSFVYIFLYKMEKQQNFDSVNRQIVSLFPAAELISAKDSVSTSGVRRCTGKVFIFYTWSHTDIGQYSDLIYCFSSVYCKQLWRLYRDLASRAAVALVEHLDLWQVSDFQQHIKSLNPVLFSPPPFLLSVALSLFPLSHMTW